MDLRLETEGGRDLLVSEPASKVHNEENSSSNFYQNILLYLQTGTVPAGQPSGVTRKQSLNYLVKDGKLYYGRRKPRLVITSPSEQSEILRQLHCSSGNGSHTGVKQMQHVLQKSYFWRNCYSDVVEFASKCSTCNSNSDSLAVGNATASDLEQKDACWSAAELYSVGPFPETTQKNRYFCILADVSSGWLCCLPAESRNCPEVLAEFAAESVINYGLASIRLHGVDSASFVKFQERLASLVKLSTSDINLQLRDSRPRCYDKLKPCVDRLVEEHGAAWDDKSNILPWLLKMRSRKGSDSDRSPYELMFGRPFNLLPNHVPPLRKRRLRYNQQQGQTNSSHGSAGIASQESEATDGREAVRSGQTTDETLTAVRDALALERERRVKRGEYKKYTADIRESIAKHALEKGVQDAVRFYTTTLGFPVNESSVRNFVKAYRAFSPQLKRDIGRFAAQRGVEAAQSFYAEKLGRNMSVALIRKFRRLYLGIHPQRKGQKKRATGVIRNVFCSSVREEIGKFAAQHGVQAAVRHYSEKLQCTIKESTVRKFRKSCLTSAGQNTLPPPPPPPPLPPPPPPLSVPPPPPPITPMASNYTLNFNPHAVPEQTFQHTYVQHYEYQQHPNAGGYSSSSAIYHTLPPYPAYNLPPPPQYHEPSAATHHHLPQEDWQPNPANAYPTPVVEELQLQRPEEDGQTEILDEGFSSQRTRKKQPKKKTPVRGPYSNYSPELRREIGQFASEHSTQETVEYFRKKGWDIPDSTVRFLRNQFLSSQKKGSTGLADAVAKGRPVYLGKHDAAVQDCIRQLAQNGEKVTSLLAITAAREVIMQREPNLLQENGGSVKLTASWAKSFLKRIALRNNGTV